MMMNRQHVVFLVPVPCCSCPKNQPLGTGFANLGPGFAAMRQGGSETPQQCFSELMLVIVVCFHRKSVIVVVHFCMRDLLPLIFFKTSKIGRVEMRAAGYCPAKDYCANWSWRQWEGWKLCVWADSCGWLKPRESQTSHNYFSTQPKDKNDEFGRKMLN